MIGLDIFTALLLTVVGGWWLHGAVRMWRGGALLSTSPVFRVQSPQRKENIDRCAPAVAALMLWLDLVFIGVVLQPNAAPAHGRSATAGPLSSLVSLGFFGALAFTLCALGIRYFDRPRFLIPPPLRAKADAERG